MSSLTRSTAAACCLTVARRLRLVVAALLTCAAALPLGAQSSGGNDADESPRASRSRAANADVATVLGMNVSSSGTERDTLGLLVSNVAPGGPADRAGVDEGNRLAVINGVSLRVDGESVGARDGSDGATRRLERELASLEAGDDVTLRLFGGGRFRTVTLHPAIPTSTRVPPARAVPSSASRGEAASPPLNAATVADGITTLQSQLRRLQQEEGNPATLDSLTGIEQELGAIKRRLRELQGSGERRGTARSSRSDALPGISLSAVADELVPYFGEGSESGLLVLKADQSWEPVRPGDVILRVNGAAATPERLRAAREGGRAVDVEVLRRKRNLTLILDPAP